VSGMWRRAYRLVKDDCSYSAPGPKGEGTTEKRSRETQDDGCAHGVKADATVVEVGAKKKSLGKNLRALMKRRGSGRKKLNR